MCSSVIICKLDVAESISFSWFFHLKLPVWAHKLEVAMTFFEQLILPYVMLVPHRWFRCFAAVAEIFFQFCIVGTGNYAWINYVGILPCIALFDDKLIGMVEKRIFKPMYDAICVPINKLENFATHLMFCIWNTQDPADHFDINSLSLENRKEVNDVIIEAINTQSSSTDSTGDKLISLKDTKIKDVKPSNENRNSMVAKNMKDFLCWTILSIYRLAIVCLLAFMTYKAKDPIKELFGPAPWINAYDDYFFMTSQGLSICWYIIDYIHINLKFEF